MYFGHSADVVVHLTLLHGNCEILHALPRILAKFGIWPEFLNVKFGLILEIFLCDEMS